MESKDLKTTITFHNIIQIPSKKTTDFGEIKKKSKNILVLTDSMLKTSRTDELNESLQEGKAYLNASPAPKAKQLNHHATAVLAQHHYDSTVIHVGINDLLNGFSIEQISKDFVEIAQGRKNRNIGETFVSGIVYCTKVSYETIQSLN